jgi:Glycosyltransferase family 87
VTRIARLSRLVAIAVVVGLSIAWIVWAVESYTLSDSHAYRLAADRLLAGKDLYGPPATQDEAFRYAPWFAAAWVPIAILPRAAGDWLWGATLLIASLVAILPLARQPRLAGRLLAVLGGTMLLWTAARGNVHPLLIAALVHGTNRRSGPVWVGLAASLKAVPIMFILVYVARREWRRAIWTIGITAVLVAPMPLLGWKLGAVASGESLSPYYLISPTVWAILAAIAIVVATVVALRIPRYSSIAAATAAILALPRLLFYDLTYLLVAAQQSSQASKGALSTDVVVLSRTQSLNESE